MFAVVEIAGQQFQVSVSQQLVVPRLAANSGENLEFTNILLAGSADSPQVGAPYINGKVSAKVIEHGRGEKILVFHKKRRKGYRKLNGHRQDFTKIEITNINI
jgi:large subunit ribosomal protein L21